MTHRILGRVGSRRSCTSSFRCTTQRDAHTFADFEQNPHKLQWFSEV